MKRGDHQRKIRPKVVYDILLKESDEHRPLSTNEIIEKLSERGISAERKTLYEDIKLLNAYGYEVLSERGRANYYYVVDRTFDTAELRILTDAVEAARFVTEKKTKVLKDKLRELAGVTGAETLGAEHLKFDVVKLRNENIFYNVDTLDECISAGKKCSFLYFDHDFDPDTMQTQFHRGMDIFARGGVDLDQMKRHALSFSWERTVRRYIEIYNDLL